MSSLTALPYTGDRHMRLGPASSTGCFGPFQSASSPLSGAQDAPPDLESREPVSTYESLADSGNKVTRKACATCNSPIVVEMEGFPEHVCLKAGSLDDAAWLTPQAHIFTVTKQPWVRISDDLPQFEGDYEE